MEEKVLLMALESQDTKELLEAMKSIIRTCTYEKFDVDNAPLFDLEYIFLKIRSKSVGETSTIRVKCKDGKNFAQVDIPLEEVNVQVEEDHTNKIEITKDIVNDYPKIDVENVVEVLRSCIIFQCD